MADVTSASILPLHQPEKRPLTGAERQAAYRQRKKAALPAPAAAPDLAKPVKPRVTIDVTPPARYAVCALLDHLARRGPRTGCRRHNHEWLVRKESRVDRT